MKFQNLLTGPPSLINLVTPGQDSLELPKPYLAKLPFVLLCYKLKTILKFFGPTSKHFLWQFLVKISALYVLLKLENSLQAKQKSPSPSFPPPSHTTPALEREAKAIHAP